MNDRDMWTIDAMESQGGGFVHALSILARRADPKNLQKIKDTWPEYWADYEARGRKLETQS